MGSIDSNRQQGVADLGIQEQVSFTFFYTAYGRMTLFRLKVAWVFAGTAAAAPKTLDQTVGRSLQC